MRSANLINAFLQRAADDERLLPSHISLFMAMFYYSPEETPGKTFQASRKKLMRFARIRSIVTYHKCIKELVAYGYVYYRPSYDPQRASSLALLIDQHTGDSPICG